MTVYTFPGEPVPKGRPRSTRSGHTYTPVRTKRAEDAIRWELKAQGAKPTSEPVQVALYFHCKSQTADLDNLIKLVLDAANGYLYDDDRQVYRIVAEIERGASEPETRLAVSSINTRYKRTRHEHLRRITELGQEIESGAAA